MKKILSLILLIGALNSCIAPDIVTTPKDYYEETINIPSSKTELYINANEWMVRNFQDARSIIQFQDRGTGTIIGKYLLHYYDTHNAAGLEDGYEVYAIIKISTKNEHATIKIEPQQKWYYGAHSFYDFYYSPEMAEKDIKRLINSFSSFMKK